MGGQTPGKASGCHRVAQGSWEQAGTRTFIEAGVGQEGRACAAAPRGLERAPVRQLLGKASHQGQDAPLQ